MFGIDKLEEEIKRLWDAIDRRRVEQENMQYEINKLKKPDDVFPEVDEQWRHNKTGTVAKVKRTSSMSDVDEIKINYCDGGVRCLHRDEFLKEFSKLEDRGE